MPNLSTGLLLAVVLSVTFLSAQARAQSQQGAAPFQDLAARASAARGANDIPLAIDLYQQALRANPRWTEGLFYLGSLLYDSDRYAEGEKVLARFIELQPDAAPAWGLLGLCEFETRAYANALKHIQKSLAAADANEPQMRAVLRFHEAALLARTGEFDRAMTKYAEFASAGAANPTLLTAIGIAALRRPLVPADIPADKQALFLNAGTAASATMAGDYAAADAAFSQLLTQFPSQPGTHYMHGLYLLARAPWAAETEMQRELALDPASAPASGTLAWLLLNNGRGAEALPYATRAVEGAPELPMAQYALGRSMAEAGDLSKGIEHLALAAKLEPGNLETHLALVSAYSKAGRTVEARKERAKSVELAQEVPAVQP